MTKQVDERDQVTGRSRPDDGTVYDFSSEVNPQAKESHAPELYFPGTQDNETRAQQTSFRVVPLEHPLYRMTPEWLLAMNALMNASVVVPIFALMVFITSVVLLFGGYIDQTHFSWLVSGCLTAVALNKKKK